MISHILFAANEVITNDYSSNHTAIDVVSESRNVSDVIAYEDGTVVFVVDDVKSNNTNTTGTATYGNFIKIKHGNNIQTLYAHLKYGSIKVKVGDSVKKGQVIATMGNTGRAFGVHLHFEVMDYQGTRKNPHDYLWTTTLLNNDENSNSPSTLNVEETVNQDNTNITEENKDTLKENEDIEENKENELETNNETELEENVLNDENLQTDFTLFENSEYKYISLADALNEIYVNNDFEYRTLLAEKNGISNYTGSKIQNLKLLQMLKEGTLKAVY